MCVAFALATLAGCGAGTKAGSNTAEDVTGLPAVAVSDAELAGAVHRLLREGTHTPERSALLAGAVRRQLAHATRYFERGEDVRGADAVLGGLYLLRVGEARPDMFEKASAKALQGAIARFSARGDEGRARALMAMQKTLLPVGSSDRTDLDAHMAALDRWMRDTRTGGEMSRLGADERAAVGRSLLEPSEQSLSAAAKAIDHWVAKAITYRLAYQQTRQLPPREEVVETFRALQTGSETMAALYLRHGRGREALEAVERSTAGRVANPAFFSRLRAVAVDDTAEDWRTLARDLAALALGGEDGEVRLADDLFQAAMWGISIEAYRRDPTSLAIGHTLAAQLIMLGMPEAAPLVLRDALTSEPTVVSLGAVTSTIAEALSEQYESSDAETARRIFAASRDVLALADGPDYGQRLTPSSSQLRQLMASVELRSGNVDAARPLLEHALRAEPTVWGYTMLGTLERQVGNLERALAHATRAAELPAAKVLQLDAADAKLLTFEILRDRGEGPRADAALEAALDMVLKTRARRITPEAEVRAERLLARVLDGYGERRRAARALERALEIADSHRQILGPTVLAAVGRALVYRDVAAARTALGTGIKAGVDSDDLMYGALWLMLLESELREEPDGKVDRIVLDAIHGDRWTNKLARWARRMFTDDALRREAKSHAERVEAEFYIGMRARAAGGADADEKLKSVATNPMIDLMEVQIARDMLAPKSQSKLPSKYALP